MSDASDNKILIKFEIHVPVGAGQTPVVVQPEALRQAAAPAPAAPPAPSPALMQAVQSITMTPTSVTTPSGRAKVKVVGTNTSGVICVTNSNDTSTLGIPLNVYLNVVPLGVSLPAPPLSTATPDGVQAETVPAGSDYTNWKHEAVGGATCEPPSTGLPVCNNTLIVYRKYPGQSHWSRELIDFRGECSDVTDCESATNALLPVAAGPIDTVPDALQVIARGFGGALQILNGKWILRRLRQAAAGNLAWVSGGDGQHQPRAELRGNACGCDPVELSFACGGKRIVYRASREQFNPLGASRFVRGDPSEALAGSECPSEMQVVPGEA